MGGTLHKALLDWGGKPLIQHQCELLAAAGCDPVVVVTGHRGQELTRAIPSSCRTVHNADWKHGRSLSFELGARAIAPEVSDLLVVAVDQPLNATVVARLMEAPQGPLIVPRDADGRTGHPILLGVDEWPRLRSATTYPQGLRSIVAPLMKHAREVDVDAPIRWDLNTLEQYQAALASRFGV